MVFNVDHIHSLDFIPLIGLFLQGIVTEQDLTRTSLWKILNLIYRDAMECFCGLGSFHLIMLSLWFFIVLKYEMPLHHEHHTMFLTVACPNK